MPYVVTPVATSHASMPAPSPRTITLRRIGNSVGATFPKDVLDRLGVGEKSEMHLVETEEGLLLKRYDADFADMMEAYEVIAKKYENALRELAK